MYVPYPEHVRAGRWSSSPCVLASICTDRIRGKLRTEGMKQRQPPETSLARYDWSRARRGRWAGRLRTAKVVLLRPEIYELFRSDEAINAALAAVAQLRELVVVPRKRRSRAA
jgi:hypothetical protein